MLCAFALQDMESEAREQYAYLKQAKIAEDVFMKLFDHRDLKQTQPASIQQPTCFERIMKDTLEYSLIIMSTPQQIAEKLLKYFNKVQEVQADIFQSADTEIFSNTIRQTTTFVNFHKNAHEIQLKQLLTLHKNYKSSNSPYYLESNETKPMSRILTDKKGIFGIPTKIHKIDSSLISSKLVNKEDSTSTLISHITLCDIPAVSSMTFKPPVLSTSYIIELQALFITLIQKEDCVLAIYENSLHISTKTKHIILYPKDISKILFRTFYTLQTGIEIFTISNKSYLLSLDRFNSMTILRALIKLDAFSSLEIQTLLPLEELKRTQIENKWKEGEISNLEYIMELNNISRSFNLFNMYPICPFVLKKPEVKGQKPDLSKEESYRDLSLLMCQDKEKFVTFSSKSTVFNLLSFIEPFNSLTDNKIAFKTYSEAYDDACEKGFELTPEFYTCTSLFDGNESYIEEFGCKTSE